MMTAMLHSVTSAKFGAISIALTLLLAPAALARADETVTFYETAFLPSTVNIVQGDSVIFLWEEGSHIVTSGESSDPADNPGELFEELLDEEHPSFSHSFNDPGVYAFFDAKDEGQIGTIIVELFELEVAVLDSEFDPQTAYVFEGEQILWVFDGDIPHTVTSGTGIADPEAGAAFDESIGFANPDFSYLYETVGTYPYFCRPHEIMGMTGSVVVQYRFVRGDVDSNAIVDLSDAVNLLDYLFLGGFDSTCLDALDANDSGAVNVADAIQILDYLFDSTGADEALPRPFPLAGADRTEDSLLCE